MKNIIRISTFFLFIGIVSNLGAQTTHTLLLKPGAEGKDASLYSKNSTTNYGNYPYLRNDRATTSGQLYTFRGIIEFDLSQIPENATINTATLALYLKPYPWWPAGHRGDYDFKIQKCTESWEENSVTWSNKPAVTTNNQVIVPARNANSDFPDIDITQLISDIVVNGEPNYGFTTSLVTETHYKYAVFASSDDSDASKWPSLEITYTIPADPATCDDGIQNGDETGIDCGGSCPTSCETGTASELWQTNTTTIFNDPSDLNVGIGTTDAQSKLSVIGDIGAEGNIKAFEFTASPTIWADYVFDTDYPLISIEKLNEYIKKNKHLPEVPTEKDVLENGVDLAATEVLLLQKIEEMTLYIIELNQRLKDVESDLEKTKHK